MMSTRRGVPRCSSYPAWYIGARRWRARLVNSSQRRAIGGHRADHGVHGLKDDERWRNRRCWQPAGQIARRHMTLVGGIELGVELLARDVRRSIDVHSRFCWRRLVLVVLASASATAFAFTSVAADASTAAVAALGVGLERVATATSCLASLCRNCWRLASEIDQLGWSE